MFCLVLDQVWVMAFSFFWSHKPLCILHYKRWRFLKLQLVLSLGLSKFLLFVLRAKICAVFSVQGGYLLHFSLRIILSSSWVRAIESEQLWRDCILVPLWGGKHDSACKIVFPVILFQNTEVSIVPSSTFKKIINLPVCLWSVRAKIVCLGEIHKNRKHANSMQKLSLTPKTPAMQDTSANHQATMQCEWLVRTF